MLFLLHHIARGKITIKTYTHLLQNSMHNHTITKFYYTEQYDLSWYSRRGVN